MAEGKWAMPNGTILFVHNAPGTWIKIQAPLLSPKKLCSPHHPLNLAPPADAHRNGYCKQDPQRGAPPPPADPTPRRRIFKLDDSLFHMTLWQRNDTYPILFDAIPVA
jgi:hypothetical protein